MSIKRHDIDVAYSEGEIAKLQSDNAALREENERLKIISACHDRDDKLAFDNANKVIRKLRDGLQRVQWQQADSHCWPHPKADGEEHLLKCAADGFMKCRHDEYRPDCWLAKLLKGE